MTKVGLDDDEVFTFVTELGYECKQNVIKKKDDTYRLSSLTIRPKSDEDWNLQVFFNGTIMVTCANYPELWELENLVKKITGLKEISPETVRMKKEERYEYITKEEFQKGQYAFLAMIYGETYKAKGEIPDSFSAIKRDDIWDFSDKSINLSEQIEEWKKEYLKSMSNKYPVSS